MSSLNFSQDVLDSTEVAVLESYIVDGGIPLDETVNKFCKPVEDMAKSTEQESELEEALAISWKAVIAHAANDSWTWPLAEKLADFVVDVERRPDVEQNGKALQVRGMAVWRELPTFGWQLRDAWNFSAGDDSDQDDKIHWVALNGFTAVLVSKLHSKAKTELDFSLFGIWTIRQALEESGTPSRVAAAAASVWFIGAAPAIWEFCRKEKSFEGKVAKPGSQYKDETWTGFSCDRWKAWSQRLDALQEQFSMEYANKLVQQARQAISEAEK